MGFEVGGFDCKERDRNLGWMMRDRMLNLLIFLQPMVLCTGEFIQKNIKMTLLQER